eukprot:CAMPEP_0195539430 /NCGR_PEP_ID=MMETSP0794_2-20130614/50045_1 /TAXON_ID=515487 /ORGANISM="Stephanopyxis turris, Strain CCMP 815" /LENGTH=65 /DNA_ID=CAMNT_0040673455 /DNA_START=778 /DNA_END=975 /DNA_ORIENTATION=-
MTNPADQRDYHKKQSEAPETAVKEEGSARRNIVRKNNPNDHTKGKKQHGGAGGKGKWNDLDDGSL